MLGLAAVSGPTSGWLSLGIAVLGLTAASGLASGCLGSGLPVSSPAALAHPVVRSSDLRSSKPVHSHVHCPRGSNCHSGE